MGRLYRSDTDRLMAGVCGGLGEYFDVDPLWIRLAFVLLVFANGLGVVAYLALWLFMPPKAQASLTPRQTLKENTEELKERAKELVRKMKNPFQGDAEERKEKEEGCGGRRRRPYFLGSLLILIGLLFLLNNLGFFWWFDWGTLWPLLLIFIGIALFLRRRAD